MTKKNDTKQDSDSEPKAEGLIAFYLPTLGVTVKASSQEEALRLATEQKDEGGDGNS